MRDNTYLVEIVPATLDEYKSRVESEEAGGSEFLGNQVLLLDNQFTNVATFKRLPPSQLPGAPMFVRLTDLPHGKQASWTGVVLLDGRNIAVSMFR